MDPDGRELNWIKSDTVSEEEFNQTKTIVNQIMSSNTVAGNKIKEIAVSSAFSITIRVNSDGNSNSDAVNKTNAINGIGSGTLVNINHYCPKKII